MEPIDCCQGTMEQFVQTVAVSCQLQMCPLRPSWLLWLLSQDQHQHTLDFVQWPEHCYQFVLPIEQHQQQEILLRICSLVALAESA